MLGLLPASAAASGGDRPGAAVIWSGEGAEASGNAAAYEYGGVLTVGLTGDARDDCPEGSVCNGDKSVRAGQTVELNASYAGMATWTYPDTNGLSVNNKGAVGGSVPGGPFVVQRKYRTANEHWHVTILGERGWNWDVASLSLGSGGKYQIARKDDMDAWRGLVSVSVPGAADSVPHNGDTGFAERPLGEIVTISTAPGYYIANLAATCNNNRLGGNDGYSCVVYARGDAYMAKGDPLSLSLSIDTGTLGIHDNDKATSALMHILVDPAKGPDEVYIQYDAGIAAEAFTKDEPVVSGGKALDGTGALVSYRYGEDFILAGEKHTVLPPSKYRVELLEMDGGLYVFDGWSLEFYTECDEDGNLSGEVTSYDGSDGGDQGSFAFRVSEGEQMRVVLHAKLTAQWTEADLQIRKIDGNSGKGLAGAEFGLYSDQAGEEPIEGCGTLETLPGSGLTGIGRLDDGTYYLRETRPPEGYSGMEEAVEIRIEDGVLSLGPDAPGRVRLDDAGVIVVENYLINDYPAGQAFELPETGGIGTAPIRVAGMTMAVLAAYAAAAGKRRIR